MAVGRVVTDDGPVTRPRTGRHARRWRDFSRPQKVLIVVSGAVELVLTAIAGKDLATRDASQVRGPKAVWVPLLTVQPLGPIAYLIFGRRP